MNIKKNAEKQIKTKRCSEINGIRLFWFVPFLLPKPTVHFVHMSVSISHSFAFLFTQFCLIPARTEVLSTKEFNIWKNIKRYDSRQYQTEYMFNVIYKIFNDFERRIKWKYWWNIMEFLLLIYFFAQRKRRIYFKQINILLRRHTQCPHFLEHLNKNERSKKFV